MTVTASAHTVRVPLSAITGGNYRPEDMDHVRDLAGKIATEGFRGDLYGFPTASDNGDGTWSLQSGFHRTAAMRSLGWSHVELVAVAAPDATEALFQQIDGNSHRLDAPAWAEAEAFGRLVEAGQTVETIAGRLGRSTAYVARRLALLELDPVVRRLALPFAWLEPLRGLDWTTQRGLVRVLDESELNRAQWSSLVSAAHVEADARAQETFGWSIEEWSAPVVAELQAVAEPERDTPVGKAEIALLLGVKRSAVYQWHARGLLPEPEMVVAGHPAWWSSTIVAWAVETGRK